MKNLRLTCTMLALAGASTLIVSCKTQPSNIGPHQGGNGTNAVDSKDGVRKGKPRAMVTRNIGPHPNNTDMSKENPGPHQ